ncbi:TIGR00725 family protein [bacterium]|nr:TIGR00725 family protein [candidate division CSSED10-310 bacterium]
MVNISTPAILIGVVGAGSCETDTAEIAETVGIEIARNNAVLVCGGLGGVMAAAARGARKGGGLTIGLLPGISHADANPDILIPIPTAMEHARNVLIVRACHGLIAISGGYGTLSEIALALKMKKPVIGIHSWSLDRHLENVSSPVMAVRKIIESVKGRD